MYFYTTEVVSPLFGAAVSTADESHSTAWYANKLGASTSVVDNIHTLLFYATEVASPE